MLECLEETRTICISFKTVSYNTFCALCTLSELSNWKRHLFLTLGHQISHILSISGPKIVPQGVISSGYCQRTLVRLLRHSGARFCHASPEVLRLDTRSFLSASFLAGKGIRCNCFELVLKKGRAQKEGKVCIWVLQEE